MSFVLSSRLLPQKSFWDQSSNLDFFPSLHKYAAFWYSAGCSLGTFDIGIFPPHLKALPHAYITSAAFSPRPFALAGQKTKCGGGLRSLGALQKKSFSLIMIMLLLAHEFLSKKV